MDNAEKLPSYFVIVGPDIEYKKKESETIINCTKPDEYEDAIKNVCEFLEKNEEIHIIFDGHGSEGGFINLGKDILPEEEFEKLNPKGDKKIILSIVSCHAGTDIKENEERDRTKELKLSKSHNLIIYGGNKRIFAKDGGIIVEKLIKSKMSVVPLIFLEDSNKINFLPPETIKIILGNGEDKPVSIKEFSPFKQFKKAITDRRKLTKEEIIQNVIEQQQEITKFSIDNGIETKEVKKLDLQKFREDLKKDPIDQYLIRLLSLALSRNHPEYIHYLISNKLLGVNDNMSIDKSRNYTALGMASESGNIEAAKTLLSLQGNINAIDYDKYTPLLLAIKGMSSVDNDAVAKKGCKEIAKYLIEKKADANIPNHNGETPLLLAIKGMSDKNNDSKTREAYKEIAKFLIQQAANNKIDLNKSDTTQYQYTALLLVIKGMSDKNNDNEAKDDFLVIARLLIINGADPDKPDIKYGVPPLLLAIKGMSSVDNDAVAKKGCKEIAKFLIQQAHKIDLDKSDTTQNGATPLLRAIKGMSSVNNDAVAKEGCKEIAKLLIEREANVDKQDTKFETTPLILAITGMNSVDNDAVAKEGCKEIAELLIKKGADINQKDKEGNNPLTIADEEIKKILKNKSNPIIEEITEKEEAKISTKIGDNKYTKKETPNSSISTENWNNKKEFNKINPSKDEPNWQNK